MMCVPYTAFANIGSILQDNAGTSAKLGLECPGQSAFTTAIIKAVSFTDGHFIQMGSPRVPVDYHCCSEKLILSWKGLHIN